MSGRVDKWNEKGGFGFIDVGGGHRRDGVFVHRTGIVDDGKGTIDPRKRYLEPGDRVEFEEAPGRAGKGPQAINVRVV